MPNFETVITGLARRVVEPESEADKAAAIAEMKALIDAQDAESARNAGGIFLDLRGAGSQG